MWISFERSFYRKAGFGSGPTRQGLSGERSFAGEGPFDFAQGRSAPHFIQCAFRMFACRG
jgi:hypothetical protein